MMMIILKLDIYLNLLGNELPKIKGARHIGGVTSDDILYLENQTCDTIEIKRAIEIQIDIHTMFI